MIGQSFYTSDKYPYTCESDFKVTYKPIESLGQFKGASMAILGFFLKRDIMLALFLCLKFSMSNTNNDFHENFLQLNKCIFFVYFSIVGAFTTQWQGWYGLNLSIFL